MRMNQNKFSTDVLQLGVRMMCSHEIDDAEFFKKLYAIVSMEYKRGLFQIVISNMDKNDRLDCATSKYIENCDDDDGPSHASTEEFESERDDSLNDESDLISDFQNLALIYLNLARRFRLGLGYEFPSFVCRNDVRDFMLADLEIDFDGEDTHSERFINNFLWLFERANLSSFLKANPEGKSNETLEVISTSKTHDLDDDFSF